MLRATKYIADQHGRYAIRDDGKRRGLAAAAAKSPGDPGRTPLHERGGAAGAQGHRRRRHQAPGTAQDAGPEIIQPDHASFREMLRKGGLYDKWRDEPYGGPQPFALVEKYSGKRP